MRIAYLASSRLASFEANAVHVMQMCDAFSHLGHEIELHAIGDRADDVETLRARYGVSQAFAIHLHRAPGGSLVPRGRRSRLARTAFRCGMAIVGLTSVRRQLASSRPDLVYARNRLWLLTASCRHVPMVLEVHSPPFGRVERAIERLLARRPHLIATVVISEALRKWYSAHSTLAERSTLVLARDAAPRQVPSPELISDQHSLTPGVGYVGSLGIGRGFHVLIELARRFPSIRFVVTGDARDAPVTAAHPLPDNLELIGRVDPVELAAVYATFDIALAPYESVVFASGSTRNTASWMSPLKIFEYMSFGKAIIASRLPAIEEIVNDGGDALLADPDDLDEWADRLALLLQDHSLRQRLGKNAAVRQQSEFTWTARAENVLSQAASSSGRRP